MMMSLLFFLVCFSDDKVLLEDIGITLFNSHFRPQIRIGIRVYMMKLPSCSTRYGVNCMLKKELLIKQAELVPFTESEIKKNR